MTMSVHTVAPPRLFSPPALLSRLRYAVRARTGRVAANVRQVQGYLTIPEGLLLQDLARAVPPNGSTVEIGSYLGRSTAFIASTLTDSSISMHCIDTWQNQAMTEGEWDTLAAFNKNISVWLPRLTLHQGWSHDVAEDWQVPIHFLWIDGDHSYEAVRQDIADWLPHVVPGGLVAFHDYANPCGVKQAVQESHSWFAQGAHLAGSIYVAQKK